MDLQNCKVKDLESFAFADCPYLDSVELGNSAQQAKDNSFAACPRLQTFRVYTTTTISKKAFNAVSKFNNAAKNNTAIADIYDSTATKASLSIDVTTEPVTPIGIGGESTPPYYVTPYEKGDEPAFSYLLIGDQNSPDTIDQYMRVEGRVASYYYKKINDDTTDAYRVGEEYFTNTKDPITVKTSAGQTVETIKITGLKPMNANETAEFNIRTAIAYERADNGRDKNEKLTPIKSEFTTTYHINIASVPFRALLYTDANRTKEENLAYDAANGTATLTQTIRACKKKATYTQAYYYDLANLKTSESKPNTCNLIIESSDPSVIAIAGSAKQVAGSTTQWKLDAAAYSNSITTASMATKGKTFGVTAKKPGTATVKIYPEGSPAQTITMTYNVVDTDSNIFYISLPYRRKLYEFFYMKEFKDTLLMNRKSMKYNNIRFKK